MTDYFYDMDLVVDPLNPSHVVANGQVAIYDPTDAAGTTLLALKDPSGLPLPNPLPSNANGFLPPRVATVPQTMWKSGGFTGYFNSFKGLRDEAVASVSAAQAAANTAATAAGQVVTTAAVNGAGKLILTKASGSTVDAGSVVGPAGPTGPKGLDGANVLPTAEAIAQAVTTDGPAKTALSATIGDQVENPSTDVNLLENFGEAAPKIIRVRSSSTPGVGVGANAGRSAIFEVGDSRAKSMIDYRFPLKADGSIWDFRDGAPPEDSYKSVAWMGVCHYWAQDQPDHNNPTDLHNHISILEMPDQYRNLHTIFDSPIGAWDDETKIGAASHRIRTNRSDFVVRVGNPYDANLGRAYRLKVTGATEYEKMVSFHSNTGGSTSGSHMSAVRWEFGAMAGAEAGGDVGSDFGWYYFTDSGYSQRRNFMYGNRATGKATFGKMAAGLGQVNAIWQDTTRDGFYAYPELGQDGISANYAAQVGSVTNKAVRFLVGGTTPVERFHILGDGKHEWASSAGTVDAVLYRSAAGRIKTDTELSAGTNVRVGGDASGVGGVVGALVLAPVTTAPTSNPAGSQAVVYQSGTIKVRYGSGVIIDLKQSAAIADATDAATTTTQLNAVLAALRSNGLIAA